MDDPAFPDSHTTTTTTTTTTTVQSPPVTVDVGYAKSLPGILRIAEIAVDFLYWILLAACWCGLGFALSMGIITWIFTICFFVIFLLQLNRRVTSINWVLTELLHDVVSAVFLLIAACLTAARTSDCYWYNHHGCRVFATLLGFGLVALFGVSIFLNARVVIAGGGLRLVGTGSGGATTTTTTTNEYAVDKEPGAPYP